MLYGLLLVVMLLLACDDKPAPDSGTPAAVDADSDGFTEDEDCDDGDPAVNPEAAEVCDGLDNDCDGTIDVDATDAETWYLDRDSDGYGDLGESTQACAQPDLYVADSTDCDDLDPEVSPDATERCDGIDNNCDGETDEAGAIDEQTGYADTDSDGYGDHKQTTRACTLPEGFVSDDQHCDDSRADVYPGAPELCVDGVDTDCDGLPDDEDTDACKVFSGWDETSNEMENVADIII